jgi:hypothetical protein
MTRKHPIGFRQQEVEAVMRCWRAAESCSLVGIGSVGKSNLIQHLADPDVQAYYLPDKDQNSFRAILIDPNLLGALPAQNGDTEQLRAWAGYELMMHRLFLAFYPFDVLGSEDARAFYETYQALQDGSNPLFAYMGLRYFEFGLQFFLRRGVQIVYMFDEFEELLQHLPVKFFQTLRGLRDQHKSQLSYFTFSRSPLPVLASRYNLPLDQLESFLELFTDNVIYVGPYNDNDAQQMLQNLMQRRQVHLPQSTMNFLFRASGCYAGLLRASFYLVEGLKDKGVSPDNTEAMMAYLVSKPTIRSECRTIWNSLTPSEHVVLKAIARLSPYTANEETEQAVAMLLQKRLVHLDKGRQRLEVQPPLFSAYLASGDGAI